MKVILKPAMCEGNGRCQAVAPEIFALDPVLRNLGFSAYFSGAYEESERALEKVAAAHPEDGGAGRDIADDKLDLRFMMGQVGK